MTDRLDRAIRAGRQAANAVNDLDLDEWHRRFTRAAVLDLLYNLANDAPDTLAGREREEGWNICIDTIRSRIGADQ